MGEKLLIGFSVAFGLFVLVGAIVSVLKGGGDEGGKE